MLQLNKVKIDMERRVFEAMSPHNSTLVVKGECEIFKGKLWLF